MIVTPQTCHLNIKTEVVSTRIQIPVPEFIPQVFHTAVYDFVSDFKVRGPPGCVVSRTFNASVESVCVSGIS
jgi:hypothetical protein